MDNDYFKEKIYVKCVDYPYSSLSIKNHTK